MAGWDSYLTERDKRIFPASGYGQRGGFGRRPAILVVDVSYAFVGDRPQPIEESVKHWPLSAGEEGWRAVEYTATLLAAARAKGVPVLYATSPTDPTEYRWGLGRWSDKNPGSSEPAGARAAQIVEPIAPRNGEIVIVRSKPSVFFGTELASYLVDLGVDGLIVCGVTTSGCVRATVVDGFSYNFRMSVVEECTFDRGEASHWINLFDMHQKYADVVSLDEVVMFLGNLEDGLFTPQPGVR
jgi:nicotinamidase-related amidase